MKIMILVIIMVHHGPLGSSALILSCNGTGFSCAGVTFSRTLVNVNTSAMTRITAKIPIAIVNPFGLLRPPNSDTSGKMAKPEIKPPNCPSTLRNILAEARSLASPDRLGKMALIAVPKPAKQMVKIAYVAYANGNRALTGKKAIENSRTADTAYGTAIHKNHGRTLPKRVCVLSTKIPKIGPAKASKIRTTKNKIPVAAKLILATSV